MSSLPLASSAAAQTDTTFVKRPPLEVPIFGVGSALAALSLGAGRLELNAAGSYDAGGTTPSLSELRSLVAIIDHVAPTVPVRVMIRPRGPPRSSSSDQSPPQPDFIYSASELDAMHQSIAEFKASDLLRADRGDGFVFGVLRRQGVARFSDDDHHGEEAEETSGSRTTTTPTQRDDNDVVHIDVYRNLGLVRLARPYKAVFHGAFDDVLLGSTSSSTSSRGSRSGTTMPGREVLGDDWNALGTVRACGFDGVLTSGGPGNAMDNVERLRRIVVWAREWEGGGDGKGVEIIVGGGVRSGNIGALLSGLVGRSGDEARAGVWYHSSCLSTRDGGLAFDEEEVEKLVNELSRV